MDREPYWMQLLGSRNRDESSKWLKIGWSKFAMDRHQKGTGHSYFSGLPEPIWDMPIHRVQQGWDNRYPGQGETCLTRKIVVPVKPDNFYTSRTKLSTDLRVYAEVTTRQNGEDPYIEHYVKRDRCTSEIETKYCNIVLYSQEALLENGGSLSCPESPADWEIVAILASENKIEPMPPLTMARNFLEKPGGTKSVYSAEEFAEAIYFHSNNGIKIKG